MKQSDRIQSFAVEIWSWYARHKRTLPWRDLAIKDDTQRAYMVLVSEVMLQQTQVSRVIGIFKEFLRRFPTVKDLAKASNKEVILVWKGMGYNSRALRLRDAARIVVDEHSGIFPHDYNQLLAIKGIGPYTAAAIRNFAFNIATPCIDTNIRRIIHRTFVGPENADGSWDKSDKELLKIAEEILQKACHPESVEGSTHSISFDAANWHAALMDFGSLVQTKSNPKWDVCPLTGKGIMKTTKKMFDRRRGVACYAPTTKEPGRFEGARYVPNRIFRGRIVDALRETEKGLTLEQIGPRICNDWSSDHREWLKTVVAKLVNDALIAKKKNTFMLAE